LNHDPTKNEPKRAKKWTSWLQFFIILSERWNMAPLNIQHVIGSILVTQSPVETYAQLILATSSMSWRSMTKVFTTSKLHKVWFKKPVRVCNTAQNG